MTYIKDVNNGILLNIEVKPRSSFNKIVLHDNDILTVYLKSEPFQNKANNELINILSQTFNISRSQITITKGAKSKIKLVFIEGIKKENAILRLG